MRKDPGIPNMAPFKEKMLNDMKRAKAKEAALVHRERALKQVAKQEQRKAELAC